MGKRQQKIAAAGVGIIVLLLLVRWYRSRQAPAAPATNDSSPGAGADYSNLAGTEQGDVAGLANQESSDISGLTSALAGVSSQESGDFASVDSEIQGLTGVVSALSDTVGNIQPADLTTISAQVASVATGETKISRQLAAATKRLKGAEAVNKRQSKLITQLAHRAGVAKGSKHTTHPVSSSGHHAGSPAHPARTGAAHAGSGPAHPDHGVQGAANGSKAHQAPGKHAGSGAVAQSTHETKPNVKAVPATRQTTAGHEATTKSGSRAAAAAAPKAVTTAKPGKPAPKPAPKPKPAQHKKAA